MTKHTVLTRTTMIAALFVTFVGLGSCKKTVTQVVDQGFSAIYTIKPGDWKVDNFETPALNKYATVLNVPEIDDVVVNNGAVMVYLSFDGGASYDALPTVEQGVSYNTIHTKGQLYIGFSTYDGQVPNQLPTTDIVAKVVILDATPLD